MNTTQTLHTIDAKDLGSIPYADAFAIQLQHHQQLLDRRDNPTPDHPLGTLLLLEHDPPVITVSRRPTASTHLLASQQRLNELGIQRQPTDRGGDVTYHGPGQLVAYPIIDLNRAHLRLHPYIRLLEQAIINTAATFNTPTSRDPNATGVWTRDRNNRPASKLAAIGVRVKRWITLHGLALNVTTNLDHFKLIVPCGLADRPVTSLQQQLPQPPPMHAVKHTLARHLDQLLKQHLEHSNSARESHDT